MSDDKALSRLCRQRNEVIAKLLEYRSHSNKKRAAFFARKDALDRKIYALTHRPKETIDELHHAQKA